MANTTLKNNFLMSFFMMNLQVFLWICLPPLYAVGVLFRDFTILQKILRIASIFFSPATWDFLVIGGLYVADYFDKQDQKERAM